MNKRENLIRELKLESKRWDCRDYSGVIFVHPDDVEWLVEYIESNYGNLKGVLKVCTIEQPHPHYYHAGCRYTYILIDTYCFGKPNKVEPTEYDKVGRVSPSDFIPYMGTRLHPRANEHSRMVII
jgi:hypothetical protein